MTARRRMLAIVVPFLLIAPSAGAHGDHLTRTARYTQAFGEYWDQAGLELPCDGRGGVCFPTSSPSGADEATLDVWLNDDHGLPVGGKVTWYDGNLARTGVPQLVCGNREGLRVPTGTRKIEVRIYSARSVYSCGPLRLETDGRLWIFPFRRAFPATTGSVTVTVHDNLVSQPQDG